MPPKPSKPVEYYLANPWKPLPEGLQCWVLREGVWRAATVIERKRHYESSGEVALAVIKGKKRTHEEMEKELEAFRPRPGADPIKDHPCMYYVHYNGWDRR